MPSFVQRDTDPFVFATIERGSEDIGVRHHAHGSLTLIPRGAYKGRPFSS